MVNKPKIGVICLGEAGNLGDDLILAAVVQGIHRAIPDAIVNYLSYGQRLDWRDLADVLDIPAPEAVKRVVAPAPRPWNRREKLFAGMDLMIVGGGGLIESTHHPYRPFQWLDNLPADSSIPVLGIGLGIGPISDSWRSYFRSRRSPFDALLVRDEQSQNMASEDIGWPSQRCLDFVDHAYLDQFTSPVSSVGVEPPTLGVSLREWPGLRPKETAVHIARVRERHQLERIRLYVLEAKDGKGVDQEFAMAVKREGLGAPSEIVTYAPARMRQFIADMSACKFAIGMKLHACAIWAASNVPVYPVVYAPKVASFYGLPYSGLSVLDRIVRPSESWTSGARSAPEALAGCLPRMLTNGASGPSRRFSPGERLKFRSQAAIVDLARKFRGALRHVES